MSYDSSHIDALFTDASNSVVVEGHTLMKTGNVLDSESGHVLANAMEVGGRLLDASKYLAFAAEVYNISPNMRDYAFVPVEIIRSEVPNKNGVGFIFEELARFQPEHGRLSYQTWTGKGCYAEHQNNRIPELAKGIIMDVALRKAPEFVGNFYRLNHLLAYDRNKDHALVQQIIKKERTSYSMGSVCQFYSCSVCRRNVNDMGGVCEHIDVSTPKARALSMRPLKNGQLAYARPHFITGIECSSVAIPAASFAHTQEVFN